MSEDDYNFDKTDHKIASALERKGLKIPTGDIPFDDVREASPFPDSLQDSTQLAIRIIGLARDQKRDKILPFNKPEEIPEEARTYAMAARKGKSLSTASDAKLKAAREMIKKTRGK